MARERQREYPTRFIATRNVREYRATIPTWVHREDVVLEIGCEWGTTTAILAQHAGEVIGTDISQECIARARERHPGLRFEVLDAFDLRSALALGRTFTKIYIDISGISGYRSLLDAIALLMMYASAFRPEAIVIKSGALKRFLSHCVPWGASEEWGSTSERTSNS